MKVQGSESSLERTWQGANGPQCELPGSELARVLLADSLQGANWPGCKKACSVSYHHHSGTHIIAVECF